MITLEQPSTRYRDAFMKAWQEMDTDERLSLMYMGLAADPNFPERDFTGFVNALMDGQENPKNGWVRGRVYWGIDGGAVVGRIGIRLELNDSLRNIGGHIGYITVPSARGRGVASEMLRLALELPHVAAMRPLLVTCDEGNDASERVITKNGGVFESYSVTAADAPRTKRFRIE